MKKMKIIITWVFLVLVWLIAVLYIERQSSNIQLTKANQDPINTESVIEEATLLALEVEANREQMTIDSLKIAENNKWITLLEEANELLWSWYNARYQSVKDKNETITNLLWL